MKRKIAQLVRQVMAGYQTEKTSRKLHEDSFYDEQKYQKEKFLRDRFREEDHFNHPEVKLGNIMDHQPIEAAVDIGAGTGWCVEELARYEIPVIAIEPSAKIMTMARRFVLVPNVEWRVGYAQDIIPTLQLPGPTLFVANAVLSHLPDKVVIDICEAIDAVAPKGSTLGFAECWGKTYHEWMWHVRSIEWWMDRFPGWAMTFHGPAIEGKKNRFKGFHGVKP